MHRLFPYLEKIQRGKPINYPVFAELCRKEKVFGLDKIFKAEHEGGQRYRVEILDEIQFNELLLRFAESGSRVAAAKTGNSHRESVGASYLLRRSFPLWQPELVWLPADRTVPAAAGKTAVVLENLENFHHFDKMSALLRQWQPENAWDAADWLFGAGNQISNALNRAYLAQYGAVYCLFDWDIGGLHIFRNLQAMLPETAVRFVLPAESEQYLMQSNRLLGTSQRDRLSELSGMSSETDRLIAAMRHTGRILEQEIYLNLV